jgi:site-specific DNA-adenine methylase
MPFAYFGAKHGLARYYPPPAYEHIIEPFAGAAGYSVYWATPAHRVTLIDSDPRVIKVWHELQHNGDEFIKDAHDQWKHDDYVTNPLLYSIGCGLYRVKEGKAAKKSTMMVQMWPGVERRIRAVLPMIERWEVICADYSALYEHEATWFLDPPYFESRTGKSGNRYGDKAHRLDYPRIANFALTRPGQVIVCEQGEADWLPFSPLKSQRTRFREGDSQVRTEVMWTNQDEPDDADEQRRLASDRRWKRMKPRGDKWMPRHLR